MIVDESFSSLKVSLSQVSRKVWRERPLAPSGKPINQRLERLWRFSWSAILAKSWVYFHWRSQTSRDIGAMVSLTTLLHVLVLVTLSLSFCISCLIEERSTLTSSIRLGRYVWLSAFVVKTFAVSGCVAGLGGDWSSETGSISEFILGGLWSLSWLKELQNRSNLSLTS